MNTALEFFQFCHLYFDDGFFFTVTIYFKQCSSYSSVIQNNFILCYFSLLSRLNGVSIQKDFLTYDKNGHRTIYNKSFQKPRQYEKKLRTPIIGIADVTEVINCQQHLNNVKCN